ncbi:MAG: CapA family protein [Thermoclostridium sp.]|nr:CapA family protein [Thermoclostridium sp.]
MIKQKVIIVILLIVTVFSGCGVQNAVPDQVDINVEPTAVPTAAPTPTPMPIITASILSAGDVIMHGSVFKSGATDDGTYDYRYIFDKVKPYIDDADFSLVSFEGVVMETDKNYTGYPLFNAPPAIMSAFADTGFDMVNQANNHSLDRKLKGLIESRNLIKQENMQVIGTYENAAEPRFRIQNLNGIKVGFLAYTYGCNLNENALTEEQRSAHLSLINTDKMKTEIEALSPQVDFVIVMMHWGLEYRKQASSEQQQLAADLFSWGADIILGSHPHVVQPSEVLEVNGETKYVNYAMGNFLSNQIKGTIDDKNINEFTEDGMMVNLTLQKDLETGKASLVKVKHIPTWVYRYTVNGVYKYSICPVPSAEDSVFEDMDAKLAGMLQASYSRTMALVEDYAEEE